MRLSHRVVHRVLVELGFAAPLDKKVERKKTWIRYKRKHSLTAVHIDWHQRPLDGPWVCAVLDDASRKLLTLLETVSPTVDASLDAMKHAWRHGRIRECISDHGCQFTSNRDGESQFAAWLAHHGIRQILCRIKHPQTNGKVERFFGTYEDHRDRFSTIDNFMQWYNTVRSHRSLRFDQLETPEEAFWRKMRAEA